MGIRDKISPAVIGVVSLVMMVIFAPFAAGIAIGVIAGSSCLSGMPATTASPSDSPAERYLSQFSAVEQTEKRQLVTLIVQIGLQRKLSVHSIEIAVATAIQESNLTNLGDQGEHNDHDSLGIFRQRPSQGWGTGAEILNPPYAINTFYDKLETISDRDQRSLMDVAIEVQNPDKDAYQARWAWDEIAKEMVAGVATPDAVSQCVNSGWRVPLDAGVYKVGDLFGRRFHPIYHVWLLHSGIDLQAPEGTPIYAASSGTVDFIGWSGDLGNFIRLNHAGGVQTGYGHMVGFAEGLEDGDSVQAGQVIGYVGTTGGSTGFHLHFTVIVDGRLVDPVDFFDTVGLSL